MALPTTITGIATTPACVGPFISSGGNVYFFGQDGTTATTLQAYKATDPTSSFSSVATKTGFSTAVQHLSGGQVGDVIHLVVIDGATTSVNAKYQTFNMSSDTFVTAETIASGFNPQTSGSANVYAGSVAIRVSGSVPVVLFNGARVANMGNSYSQVYHSFRIGEASWTAAAQVSAGGQVNFTQPEAVLGTSDRVHFIYRNLSNDRVTQRALSSGNSLQTVGEVAGVSCVGPYSAVSYDNGGTIKVVCLGGNDPIVVLAFDSADNPTEATGDTSIMSNPSIPTACFVDGTDVWALLANSSDSDLYVAKSTDNGATFGSATNAMTATVAAAGTNLSVDGNIFTRGSSVVIPYVVNDNGTLKYNEYVVRTIVSDTLFAQSVM
jgi:hypothetical protein